MTTGCAADPAVPAASRELDARLAAFSLPPALAIGDRRPRIPDTFKPERDPRASFVLQRRDVALVGNLLRNREQRGDVLRALHVDASLSVFTRRLGTLEEEGLLVRERVLRTAFVRARATTKAATLLAELSVMDEADAFVPRRFTPLKDMAHHHLVGSLTALLDRGVGLRWDGVFPSWLIQRRLSLKPATSTVPDVLAVRASSRRPPGRIWAFEVDLGTERLKGSFVPKLALLANDLRSWANGAELKVIVFTRGVKRLAALETAVREAALPVPVTVDPLPREAGLGALEGLRQLLSPAAESSVQAPTGDLP